MKLKYVHTYYLLTYEMMHVQGYSLKGFKECKNRNNEHVHTPIDYSIFKRWDLSQSLQRKTKLIYTD